MNLTDAALEEWREHPVSLALKEALRRYLDQCKAAALDAWWQGNPVSDDQRLALHREIALWADLFEASGDDLRKFMETKD